jgi:hypothetical protein
MSQACKCKKLHKKSSIRCAIDGCEFPACPRGGDPKLALAWHQIDEKHFVCGHHHQREVILTSTISGAAIRQPKEGSDSEPEFQTKQRKRQKKIIPSDSDESSSSEEKECACVLCYEVSDNIIHCQPKPGEKQDPAKTQHIVCLVCARRMFNVNGINACPDTNNCENIIAWEDLKLDPERHIKLVTKDVSRAFGDGQFFSCSGCHVSGMMTAEDAQEMFLQCYWCKHKTCPKCQYTFHNNLSCEDAKIQASRSESQIEVRKSISKFLSSTGGFICPKCGEGVTKQKVDDSGVHVTDCNKLHCKCGTFLCSECEGHIRNTPRAPY